MMIVMSLCVVILFKQHVTKKNKQTNEKQEITGDEKCSNVSNASKMKKTSVPAPCLQALTWTWSTTEASNTNTKRHSQQIPKSTLSRLIEQFSDDKMWIWTEGIMLKTVCVRVWRAGSHQLRWAGSQDEVHILLLLLWILQFVAPLSFTLLRVNLLLLLLLHFLLYCARSHSPLCLRPLCFSFRSWSEKFPKPRPVQILLELHLERWQSEQKGPDPAGWAQVCRFILVLHLHILLSSSSSTSCRVGALTCADVLGLLRAAGSGSLEWRWICVSMHHSWTRLRSLCARSLSHEAFAKVERQRLLGRRGDGRAGRLGAQVLGQGLRQSAGEGLELRRAQTSSHQLAHLNTAVQVQGQDPERGQRRSAPGVPAASSRGSLIHVTPRAAVVLLVERVRLRLELLPAGMRRIWASTFWLEGVDGWMVLGGVLRRQGRALWSSLEADAVPEDIQGTHAFDGAEATEGSSNKVARQSGEEHTGSRSNTLPSVRLQLLWFGLEGEEGGWHGGEVGGERHVDGEDGWLDRLQGGRRKDRRGHEKKDVSATLHIPEAERAFLHCHTYLPTMLLTWRLPGYRKHANHLFTHELQQATCCRGKAWIHWQMSKKVLSSRDRAENRRCSTFPIISSLKSWDSV